jgi:photosystem II stability/assembly factor-like uncharacterized protein
MAEKVFVVLTVARQVDGEYVFVKTEGAFHKAKNADALIKKLRGEYVSTEGKFRPVEVSTPQGAAVCQCEVGAHEMEFGD